MGYETVDGPGRRGRRHQPLDVKHDAIHPVGMKTPARGHRPPPRTRPCGRALQRGPTAAAGTAAELATSLAARHNPVTLISELRAARADLTTPAHYETPPIPVSLTLGPDAVAELGISPARNVLPVSAPTHLGPAAWQHLQ